MDIDIILSELNIPHNCYGNTTFDSLGLLGSKADQKLCSFIIDMKYKDTISDCISVVLTDKNYSDELNNLGICVVKEPRFTFFQLHNYLTEVDTYRRPKKKTVIGENTLIHKLASVADYNVEIGNNVVIEEFVSIKENVKIGDNCIIRAGTVVGGEGFEQKRHGQEVLSVHHAGGVIIGNHVELQQGNCVDKAIYPWDNTEIGDYCRTDNKVHIAHADKLKKRVLIAACACIAGRVTIEDDVWIGPGATIINGIRIGKGARVNIGAVATRDVPDGASVTGNFAIDHKHFLENLKKIR